MQRFSLAVQYTQAPLPSHLPPAPTAPHGVSLATDETPHVPSAEHAASWQSLLVAGQSVAALHPTQAGLPDFSLQNGVGAEQVVVSSFWPEASQAV